MALGIFDIVFKITGAGDAVQSLKNIKTEAKSTADSLDKTKTVHPLSQVRSKVYSSVAQSLDSLKVHLMQLHNMTH